MSADALLARLAGVRRTGTDRWLARCPAHDDRRPSLSLRAVADGRVLLHCWAGCETADVLDAIGATWADIYPPRDRSAPGRPVRREPVALAGDALLVLAHEARILVLLAGDLARGRRLSTVDRSRLLQAAERIGKAESLCSA